jgi:hypothetical protein
MPEISLTEQEIEVLAGYINIENDGIDMYPGTLDGAALGVATAEVERLRQTNGQGVIGPLSARLAADVLSFFLESFRPIMQPWEAAATESVVTKLNAASAGQDPG